MEYPKNCVRGIPNDSYITNGDVGAHLFYFKLENVRKDGWIEQSVNWEDDDMAIDFTLKTIKENGDIQFKAGAVVIPRNEIDYLTNLPTIKGSLWYERQPLDNNPYHGNLLLRKEVPSREMKKIASGIALMISNKIFSS